MTRDAPISATVLVVEDDAAILAGLVDALGFEGYRVLQASDAPSGAESALRSNPDLVLLDLMLPGGDGFSVLSEVRRIKPSLPVIIITARGREVDRVRGLRLGADDYVVKPFSIRELLARVEAVLRRSPPAEANETVSEVRLPAGVVDLARAEVRFDDGSRNDLSQREVAFLAFLAQNADRAIARDEILKAVWNVDPTSAHTRTIDMHVARLREKLRDPKDAPELIRTVRGKGYMFAGSTENS